jgi:hypothetical protein
MSYTDGCGPVVSTLERRKTKNKEIFIIRESGGLWGTFLSRDF